TVTDGAFTTGDGLVVTTREPIAVAVSPSFGFVDAGGTLQFTATVTGTSDQRVSWVAAGGSISASGLYTAGPTAGVFAVRAVSLADPTVSGTASVQVTDDNVEGRYSPGTVCLFNDVGDENCSTGGFILDYHCSWQSNLHAGTTCGWFSGQGFQQVPSSIPLCFFETDGTKAGGAFVGKVTFCRFRPASNYAATRIEGTIGDGRLEFSVFAPGFDGTERLWERISMTKAP
ncbi:MAG: hypothetical protein HOQ03_11670, partial [Thermoleophilia bacterium]|nr:hypothetical protein [Thermoleophilia bacterium]